MACKNVFLFPGQGAQYNGMALDFFGKSAKVRELFALASDIFSLDMKKTIAEADEETLKSTCVAQPAITLANLACAAYLAEKGVEICAAAGHSLGEFAALCVAGVLSEGDCFTLVKARAAAMQKCVESGGGRGGMAAVLGLPPETVGTLVEKWRGSAADGETKALYAANFNSPRQTVVSGSFAALDGAEKFFKESGAKRALRLKVAGPFHSPLMVEAAAEFELALEKAVFAEPKIKFFSNVTGREAAGVQEIKSLAALQITSPVRWTEEEAAILALSPERVFEAGPGTVLSGLWKDLPAASAVPCAAAGKAADIDALAANL